jgi:hypothetical protein
LTVPRRAAHNGPVGGGADGTTCEAFVDCEDLAAEPAPKKPARRKRKGE